MDLKKLLKSLTFTRKPASDDKKPRRYQKWEKRCFKGLVADSVVKTEV